MRKSLSLFKLYVMAEKHIKNLRTGRKQAREAIESYLRYVNEHKYDEFPDSQTNGSWFPKI